MKKVIKYSIYLYLTFISFAGCYSHTISIEEIENKKITVHQIILNDSSEVDFNEAGGRVKLLSERLIGKIIENKETIIELPLNEIKEIRTSSLDTISRNSFNNKKDFTELLLKDRTIIKNDENLTYNQDTKMFVLAVKNSIGNKIDREIPLENILEIRTGKPALIDKPKLIPGSEIHLYEVVSDKNLDFRFIDNKVVYKSSEFSIAGRTLDGTYKSYPLSDILSLKVEENYFLEYFLVISSLITVILLLIFITSM